MDTLLSASNLVALSFFIFWLLVFTKARGQVKSALNSRVNVIRERILAGERLRDEAREAVSHAEQELQDAQQDSKTIQADAKAAAKEAASKIRARNRAFIKSQEKGVEERIIALRLNASKQVRDQIVDVAINASGTVLKQKYTKDTSSVEKSVKELPFEYFSR